MTISANPQSPQNPALDDSIPDIEEPGAPRLKRTHVVVIAVLLSLGLFGAGFMVVRQQPLPEPVPEPTTLESAPSDKSVNIAATTTATPRAEILVHVAGKVRRPGVFRLPTGARVIDAIEAAGGAKPGVDSTLLNLARPLLDGEQVLVGLEGRAPPNGGGAGNSGGPGGGANSGGPGSPAGNGGAGGSAAGGPIDLNTATLEQLDTLPGVGPVLAQRILDYRTQRGGRFTSIDELREVTGIGEKRFSELRERLVVS